MRPDADEVKSTLLERFGGRGSGEGVSTEKLLAALVSLEAGSEPLMDAVSTALGDSNSTTPEQTAILTWLDEGLSGWREGFPLDEGLSPRFDALAPVIAAQALTDASFLGLGTHPLHRLLDALHDAAVGWESSLGRAGEGLEKDLDDLVARCYSWFEDRSVSFAEIAADLEIRLKRAATRAERMNQRLAEKEQGRVQINACRREAAQMINRHLESPLPATINDFLQGHWFDSAQLVLLKHSANSEEWASMREATERLLESARQDSSEEDENRRQHLFQLVSQLPRELKRWLYSLQHDKEAIDDTLGLVEYVHLRLLRDEELELQQAQPLVIEDSPGEESEAPRPDVTLDQWYSLATNEGMVRGRLVLDLPGEFSLVFADFAGALAATISYRQFALMREEGLATRLETGSTFTRSLTAALEAGSDAAAPVPAATSDAEPESADKPQRLIEDAEPAVPGSPRAAPEAVTDETDTSATIMPFPEPERTVDPQALPIGSWLGFHDRDVPLMARLAVHDPEQDSYIFVDRKGIKLRELSGRDLQSLFDADCVDVLELRAPPRTEIKPSSTDDQGELA